DVSELMLLALHDMRIARLVPQQAEIELGNNFATGTIPDAELGFDQSTPSHEELRELEALCAGFAAERMTKPEAVALMRVHIGYVHDAYLGYRPDGSPSPPEG